MGFPWRGSWRRTRRIAVTGRPAAASAPAMSGALGRCDAEPAAYLTARPIARPPITVISRVRTEVCNTPTCTIAYTAIADHRAFRQYGRLAPQASRTEV